jgi:Domain of Unknown Function (DUF748)
VRRAAVIATIIVGAIAIALFIASYFLDGIARARLERAMNEKLKGYHTRVAHAHVQLVNGSVTLNDVKIIQNAHPAPPVAIIPALNASIQWEELLSGHVVADFLISRPRLYVNLIQLRQEKSDKVPISKKGWQDALQNIYPFKINRLAISSGDFIYIDTDPNRPLRLTQLNFVANNIRNIHSPDKTYPSPIHADAVVFDKGRLALDGRANFLSTPFAGIYAQYRISEIPLSHFEPAIKRANLNVQGGTFRSEGVLEYSPQIRRAEVSNAVVEGINLDYVHKALTTGAESQRVSKVKQTGKKVSNEPGLVLKIHRVDIEKSRVAFTDQAKNPPFKLFMTDLSLLATRLSNHFEEGPATVNLRGKFMGSGDSSVTGTFRPEKQGPDFNLDMAIRNTDLPSLNDLLRAYGRLDVAAGQFSLFSQLGVRDGEMNGYIKPLFSNLKVYSYAQDKNKPVLKQAYQMAVGAASHLFRNPSTNQVATQVNVAGNLKNPDVSTWQAMLQLIQNAFVQAILPGFDRQVNQVTRQQTGR